MVTSSYMVTLAWSTAVRRRCGRASPIVQPAPIIGAFTDARAGSDECARADGRRLRNLGVGRDYGGG